MSAPVTDKQHGFRGNGQFPSITEMEVRYTINCRKYYVCHGVRETNFV